MLKNTLFKSDSSYLGAVAHAFSLKGLGGRGGLILVSLRLTWSTWGDPGEPEVRGEDSASKSDRTKKQ